MTAPTSPAPEALNKEQVYDAQINPLVAQIMEICQAHGIAMLASFAIPTPEDADLMCSSLLPDGEGNSHGTFVQALRVIRGAPQSFALTVIGGRK